MNQDMNPQQYSIESVKKFMADKLAAVDAPDNASLLDACLRPGHANAKHYTDTMTEHSATKASQFVVTKSMELPIMVQSYVSAPDYVLRLGMLSEIGRAFVVKDNRVVLWSVGSPAECVVHEEEQVIRHVALIVPRPNVFSPSVRYILAVATPILIRLLTVQLDTSSGVPQGSCPLELTPVMSVSTDGNRVESIVGTSTGRIFVGGDSGVLQELIYSSERDHAASLGAAVGIQKRARTVPHPTGSMDGLMYTVVGDLWGAPAALTHLAVDHHRHLLWAADAQGGLAVWSLGRHGGDMRLIQKVPSLDKVVKQGGGVRVAGAGGSEVVGASNPVADISVVSPYESARVHAVITTANGGRLFLTTSSVSTYPSLSRRQDARGGQKRITVGTHLNVTKHIPAPPAVTADCTVASALYSQGVTLMATQASGAGAATGPLVAVATDMSSVVPLHTPGEHASAARSRSEWTETVDAPLTGVQGTVHCVQELPQCLPWGDTLAPSGAVLVPGGVTAPLPPPSKLHSRGQSTSQASSGVAVAPLDLLYSLVGSVLGGAKRPRAEGTPSSAPKGGVSARLGGSASTGGTVLPRAVQSEFDFARRRVAEVPVLETDTVARQLKPLSELAAQLLPGSVRQFQVITETHIHVLSKVRPVDRLAQVLLSCAEGRSLADSEDLKAFVARFGPVETCAMAASIACSGGQALLQLPPLHGGARGGAVGGQRTFDTDNLRDLAVACLQVFADFTRLRRTGAVVERQYPAKTWGMLLYARRLLSVFWQQPVLLVENLRLLERSLGVGIGASRVQLTDAQKKSIVAHGLWSPGQLQGSVASLRALQATLRRMYGDDVTVHNPRVLVEAATDSTLDAAYDAMVAARLHVFLERVAQTFALGGILGAPATRVAAAFGALEGGDKKRAAALTFEDLATGAGSAELIAKLLSSVSTDVRSRAPGGSGASGAHDLAERLGRECPAFFAREDSLLWTALRDLDKALSGVAGTADAAEHLVAAAIRNTEEALRLGRVTHCLPNLLAVLDRLCALGQLPKAVELAVLFAQSADGTRWSAEQNKEHEAQALLSALDKSGTGVNADGTRVLPALEVFQEHKRDERRNSGSWGQMLSATVLVHALAATVAISQDSARSAALVRAMRADAQRSQSGGGGSAAGAVPPGAFSQTDVLRYVVRTALAVLGASYEPLLFSVMWWLSTPSDAVEGGAAVELDADGLTPSLRTLLLLASGAVSDFLRYTQQLPRLHQHYKLQGKPVRAARIRHALAEQAATTDAGVFELEHAVAELEQVLQLDLATGDDVGIVLASWSRELDVARLQQRVARRLQQLLQGSEGDAGGLRQAIEYLRREQLNIDALFELCKEHRFIEEQLHLLRIVASPRHLQMVHALWEQLLQDVENTKMTQAPSSGAAAPGHRADSSRRRLLANRESLTAELKLRAGRLANELYTPLEQSAAQHAFTAFPVAHVVFLLEEYGVRCGWVEAGQNRADWVSVDFLNKAGVPWRERFSVYSSLLARNVNPDWTTLALVRAACAMIAQWVALAESATGAAQQQRGGVTDRAAVSAHELHALVGAMKDALGDWSQLVREACAAHGIPTGPENTILEHSKGLLQEFSAFMGDANGDAGGALM